ncbi:MAG: PspC domain-containing protein [Planctomycetes bacterium]|nr:PspC domain-containing protein [Planctomycetota bacterium]
MEGKLYRSRSDRKLLGVCGGLGAYVHLDPTLVRVLFVLLALLGAGLGVVLYIVLVFIVPLEPGVPPGETTPVTDLSPQEQTRDSS